jgi:site-specific DNA-methyltransferase (adenine-specific)
MKPYYEHGGITIYHGDCREVLPLVSGVDLVLTDPPYFVPANSYTGKRGEGYHRKMIGDTSIMGMAFELIFTHYVDPVVASTGTYYVFCDPQSYPHVWAALYPLCHSTRMLVWDKQTSFNGYTWRRQFELIAWGSKPDAVQIPTGDGDVLKHRAVKVDDRVHPAEKPTGLIGQLIGKHKSRLVLDPFCGSGAVLATAQAGGYNAIGIEIEERYCEIAAKRLSQEVLPLEQPA